MFRSFKEVMEREVPVSSKTTSSYIDGGKGAGETTSDGSGSAVVTITILRAGQMKRGPVV
jgi:hypothetical protein